MCRLDYGGIYTSLCDHNSTRKHVCFWVLHSGDVNCTMKSVDQISEEVREKQLTEYLESTAPSDEEE